MACSSVRVNEETRPKLSRDRNLIRVGSAVGVGLLCAWLLATPARAQTEEETEQVTLVVVIDDETTEYKPIPIEGEVSVADVLKLLAKSEKEFVFKSRGKGETFFVTEINDRKNEGARGRNWIFHVNDQLGNKSAGAFLVKAGDKIQWKFQKYNP